MVVLPKTHGLEIDTVNSLTSTEKGIEAAVLSAALPCSATSQTLAPRTALRGGHPRHGRISCRGPRPVVVDSTRSDAVRDTGSGVACRRAGFPRLRRGRDRIIDCRAAGAVSRISIRSGRRRRICRCGGDSFGSHLHARRASGAVLAEKCQRDAARGHNHDHARDSSRSGRAPSRVTGTARTRRWLISLPGRAAQGRHRRSSKTACGTGRPVGLRRSDLVRRDK